MSMNANGAIGATTAQLVAALVRYEGHMGRLALDWLEPSIHAEVAHDMDAIQRCCASVPGASVPAIALLIAHSELLHVLWRGGDVARVSGDHRACLQSLQLSCLRLLAREHG